MTDTITMPRSVVEQALKALEKADRISGYRNNWAEVNSLIAALEQPQVEQETVGEAGSMPGADGFTMACFRASDVPVGTKLYTHPQPKRQPLTNDEIYKMGLEHKRLAKDGTEWFDRESFARAIERAHGIGGEA